MYDPLRVGGSVALVRSRNLTITIPLCVTVTWHITAVANSASMYFWNENFALVIACHAVYCLVIFFKVILYDTGLGLY